MHEQTLQFMLDQKRKELRDLCTRIERLKDDRGKVLADIQDLEESLRRRNGKEVHA
jgi:uncharacterized protein (UPF0335 family)